MAITILSCLSQGQEQVAGTATHPQKTFLKSLMVSKRSLRSDSLIVVHILIFTMVSTVV